ncbi:MAG: ABC transporter ATP-binding protein [Candidatus Heimdallarchaeota archaeon]
MIKTILECVDVYKSYQIQTGSLAVLKGVTFQLHKGELLAVVGVSGSGKTTLLNLLFGIDSVTKGKILINGKDLTQLSEEEFRIFRQQNMGMIFQEFYLIPSMTAIENVMTPIILAGHSEEFALNKALQLLDRVEMSAMVNKYPHQLSNGQKQRVVVARAIANDPRILICDEPTRALDTTLGDEIMDLIQGLIKKENLGVIITTHDPEIAVRADRILVLRDGKLVEEHIKDKKAFDFRVAKALYQKKPASKKSKKRKKRA